jgi:hypothetical protein
MSVLKFNEWQDLNGDKVYTAAELNAIGTWTTYTPTVTNWTGTFPKAEYSQINDIVFWRLAFQSNSTSTGTVAISLPVAANIIGGNVGQDFSSSGFWVSSGGGIAQIWPVAATTTTVEWYIIGSGVLTTGNGSGAVIRYMGFYKAA